MARNITRAGIGSWTEADFVRAMRTGVRPDGSTMNPAMPWPLVGQMPDQDLRAIWLYLRAVPPRGDPMR